MAKKNQGTTDCRNPNTGRVMQIDTETYQLFEKAIRTVLYPDKELTFTGITEGIHALFRSEKIAFKGSLEWYAVSVKNDMQVRGGLEVFMRKGRKMHRLAK